MEKDFCPYCWPTKRVSHFALHFDFYNDAILGFIFRPLTILLNTLFPQSRDKVWGVFLQLLSWTRFVEFTAEPDTSKIHDRSLMFFLEAKKRGLEIEATYIKKAKRYSNDFRFKYKGKWHYYESVPLTMFASPVDMDNKLKIKKILAKNKIPVPAGKKFFFTWRALSYAKILGYPLVVKPNSGSLSMHVTVNIENDKQLKQAIKIAKIYQPFFIIEKFIPGRLYRATVLSKENVLVCERQTAHVIGDGKSTVMQLVEEKNQKENRTGELRADGTMAFPIDLDEITEKNLADTSFNVSMIPRLGEMVYLTKKFTPQSGNDIVIKTAETHAKNIELFKKVSKILKTEVVGIDIICDDISLPYFNQQFALIETNSVPYTNVHQYPSQGKPEPAAQLVWDMVFKKLS